MLDHYPCERLNPDQTCPVLKQAWGMVMEKDDRLVRFEGTKLQYALDYIDEIGHKEEFNLWLHYVKEAE